MNPNTAGCELPELAYGFTRGECGELLDLEVYRLGPEVPESERLLGEACGGTPLEGELLRTERDDDAVPWLHRSRRGSGRLRPTVWTDDGGRAVLSHPSYFDTELAVNCSPISTAAGTRCVPEEAIAGYRELRSFADDACTRPALPRTRCDPPAFVSYHGETDGCLSGLAAVYRVGAPIETVYWRHPETGACNLSSETGFALEPLPFESLAPVERVIE